jgi:glycosyltransferase involved in cell wall biosynthesis
MSVYNDARFLRESIDSILGQSLTDFEFLIVNDGSTDGTSPLLERTRDPRVRILRNPANLGLTRSLNRGLDEAKGAFVARMDADDVSLPNRLQLQVEFLRAHPDVGIVGCARTLIDEMGAVVVAHAPAAEDDRAVRWKCLLGNPFAHPAVMLRREVLDSHGLRYDPAFRTAQDYELWSRLLTVTRGANLPEPLLKYRLRDGVSRLNKPDQLRNHDRIAHAAITRLVPGYAITLEEVTQLRGRFGGHSVRDPSMDPSDPRWQEKYLDLQGAFASTYAGELAANGQ